jgi:hypothetical protein
MMSRLDSQEGAAGLKVKLMLFILVLIIGFAFLDVVPLMRLHEKIKFTHIQEKQLNQIRYMLFQIYTYKTLWLFILSGIAAGFGYWVVRPYKHKLSKEIPPEET